MTDFVHLGCGQFRKCRCRLFSHSCSALWSILTRLLTIDVQEAYQRLLVLYFSLDIQTPLKTGVNKVGHYKAVVPKQGPAAHEGLYYINAYIFIQWYSYYYTKVKVYL